MPPEIVQSWALWLAALVAGLTALAFLAKKAHAGFRWLVEAGDKIGRLDDLASYELQHNGGTSIKDRVLATQQALDEHLRKSTERETRTLALLNEHTEAIRYLAEALPVVARATPDPTDTSPGG